MLLTATKHPQISPLSFVTDKSTDSKATDVAPALALVLLTDSKALALVLVLSSSDLALALVLSKDSKVLALVLVLVLSSLVCEG